MGLFDSIATFFDRITTLPGGGSSPAPAPIAAPPPAPVLPPLPTILQQPLQPQAAPVMPTLTSGLGAAQAQRAALLARQGRESTILTARKKRRTLAGDTQSFDTYGSHGLGLGGGLGGAPAAGGGDHPGFGGGPRRHGARRSAGGGGGGL